MRVLTEGTRLADRYSLIRRLGQGGMSEVWLASDSRTGADVALKFLAPHLAVEPRYRKRFHREWQVGSRLMHAHIARVFEYHDDPDGPYYSQQAIGGPEIRVVTGEPAAAALRPFVLVADALRYAHEKGIVHRDVKAGNVLLDGRGLPYLVDFGVSGDATGEAEDAHGGTPITASPQQLAGKPPAPADDIYALAVLMHEVLFGRPPARGAATSAEVPLAADGSALDDELRSLLGDMLSVDEAKRPSAAEVAERLRGAGIVAGPATLRDRPAGSPVETEIVVAERSRSLPPASRDPGATRAGADGGVSARTVFTGLAVLVMLVIAVVFVLPDALDTERVRPVEPATTPEDDLAAGNADPAEATPTVDAAEEGATTAELRARADESLGAMLSSLERLKARAVERWGGRSFEDAQAAYEQGDEAYLQKDFALAAKRYREAKALLEPLFDRVDEVFEQAMQDAQAAFAARDHSDAVRLYDLAAAISPANRAAQEGLARAQNLETVLDLTQQALSLEGDLELEAAKLAFERALDLDPAWQPARTGLDRIVESIRQRSFQQRMTEGLEALVAGDYQSARAAFNAAKALDPDSQQPVDGLLQVDQEVRLDRIQRMEQEAAVLEEGEQWQEAIDTYEEILEVDPDLQFAREGLARTRERAAIHRKLKAYMDDPDSLSAPATMQAATRLLLDISRMNPVGPRLEGEKNELSRLLKRAATPLKVQLISDNATEVSIFQVGRLGTFSTHELSLRPGSYVATGSRVGYRDVRLEFRVAPEMDLEPIVIQCEERI